MSGSEDQRRPSDQDEPGVAPYQPQLISGKWVIVVVGAISLFGAAFGWLYTYDAQRMPRDFWGIRTWKLIGLGPEVTAQRLVPEPASADGKPKPAAYDGLLVVHYDPGEPVRFVVEAAKRVENRPGISIADQSASLREALANHRSYDWNSKAAALQRPVWRYALVFTGEVDKVDEGDEKKAEPGHQWPHATATLLFNADCRFVRVPNVDKPIELQPSVAEQFKKFFHIEVPEEPAKPQAGAPAPAATGTPSATGAAS